MTYATRTPHIELESAIASTTSARRYRKMRRVITLRSGSCDRIT
jgi:hypothetical protein